MRCTSAAAVDYEQISRIDLQHEFPWDIQQALSFALFRTYSGPSIGQLLVETGELTQRTQRRHDDTALILGAVVEHGLDSGDGRAAVRRLNRMHGRHAICDEDMRYVLATFVVMPKRWLDAHGWRPLSGSEVAAGVAYYRRLGTYMSIRDIPGSFKEFERLLDSYEAEHFANDHDSRAVADATMALFTTFFPGSWRPPRGCS